MDRRYHLNLHAYTLTWFYREHLLRSVVPSRAILLQQCEDHLSRFREAGIHTLAELYQQIKTGPAAARLRATIGLNDHYLKILRREILSFIPKPIALNRMIGVSGLVIEKLAALSVTHGGHLFDAVLQNDGCAKSFGSDPIEAPLFVEIVRYVNLTRVAGIGAVLARVLLDVATSSLIEIGQMTPSELRRRVSPLMEAGGYQSTKPTTADYAQIIWWAGELPKVPGTPFV